MSLVVGLDFGNGSLVIGVCNKGGVDIILNDSSNRQTATCVSIQGRQRYLGDAATTIARSNLANTITCMKLLVGRNYDSESVQRELRRQNFRSMKLPSGGVGIALTFNGAPLLISAEHALAMMLVKAVDIVLKAKNNVPIGDAVLAVPNYFTDAQRKGLLTACEIIKLNCIRVINESCAIALSYGIFRSAKRQFSETVPSHVMFIDVGYTCFSVTIVDFVQEKMQVRSSVCEQELGGRNFDEVIVEFLIEVFQKKTGINIKGNAKAILKLRDAAEKAKKTLSPAGVNEANISVECLAEDRDLNVILTREEFEKRCSNLVSRLQAPIEQCLAEANLTRQQLSEVEIVGGGSRVNIVKRRLGEILGLNASLTNYGLKTTMNSDEAVASGATLCSAMESVRMKVKPFSIIETLYYGIVATYDGCERPVQIYSRGDQVPHKAKQLTFRNKTSDFSITLSYDSASSSMLPSGDPTHIITYTIKVPPPRCGGPRARYPCTL